MHTWSIALRRAVISGSIAAATSTLALVACGWIERRKPLAPNNGPSQWIWGRRGAESELTDVRHTLVGYAIHHAMSIGWALLFERGFQPTRTPNRIAQGIATSAAACLVDYRVAPRRLQPGFDAHLGRASLFAVYAAFGLGLALGAMALDRRTKPAAMSLHSLLY